MLSFAASRLCGRAVMAAWLLSWCFPATLSRRSRRSAAWAGKAHIFAARDRRTASPFETEEAPVGGRPGLPNGRSPLGGGEDDRPIDLNGAQRPAVPPRAVNPVFACLRRQLAA